MEEPLSLQVVVAPSGPEQRIDEPLSLHVQVPPGPVQVIE